MLLLLLEVLGLLTVLAGAVVIHPGLGLLLVGCLLVIGVEVRGRR